MPSLLSYYLMDMFMRYMAASFLILTLIQKSNHLWKTNTDHDVK